MKRENPYRMSITDFCEEEGLNEEEVLAEYATESVVPAICTEGCEVEPDGRCEHKCPSILLALGVI